MAKTELGNNTQVKTEDSSNLKGTLASVFFVGLVMLVTWASMYFIYVGRL